MFKDVAGGRRYDVVSLGTFKKLLPALNLLRPHPVGVGVGVVVAAATLRLNGENLVEVLPTTTVREREKTN